tara:strand:+ start:358 stop:510 length:153 start_codon:yes stop_codon:yes gene_type:complete
LTFPLLAGTFLLQQDGQKFSLQFAIGPANPPVSFSHHFPYTDLVVFKQIL